MPTTMITEDKEERSSLGRELGFGGTFGEGSQLVSGDGGIDIELVPSEDHPNVRVEVYVTGFGTLDPDKENNKLVKNVILDVSE